jgi:hypothetical protein
MEDRTLDRISRSLAGVTSRRQALKLLGGGIATGALGANGLSQASAAPKVSGTMTIDQLVGTVGGNPISGTLDVTQFVNEAGTLNAVGTLTTLLGDVFDFVAEVVGATGDCEILDLTLGPITLDLLGLVVTTNAIHINITAESGPGNLLGNLLCAVANLLNGGGPLGALSGLLNRILALLGS